MALLLTLEYFVEIAAKDSLEYLLEIFLWRWLVQEMGHSWVQASLLLFFAGIGGAGNDVWLVKLLTFTVGFLLVEVEDMSGCLDTAHYWHLYIHEDDSNGATATGELDFDCVKGFLSIADPSRLDAIDIAQHRLEGH